MKKKEWEMPTTSMEGRRILTEPEKKQNGCELCSDVKSGRYMDKTYHYQHTLTCPHNECPYVAERI